MKKLLLIGLLGLMLTSCGNMNYGWGNYSYTKVHIFGQRCYEIESWNDNDIGIEVKTKDYGSLYLSEGTYMLVEDKCPICDFKY